MNLRPKDIAFIVAGVVVVGALAWVVGGKHLKGQPNAAATFKDNFLNSCGRKAPDKLQYCMCFYNGLEKAKVTELPEAKVMEYLKSPDGIKIAQGCLKELIAANPNILKPNPAAKGKGGKSPASTKPPKPAPPAPGH